jgi:hypothetical protein
MSESFFKNNKLIYKLILVMLLVLYFTVLSVLAMDKSNENANGNKIAVVKSTAKEKRYYEVMWAADANFCEKVRTYADRENANYVPIAGNFGNVKWIALDHPTRKAVNVIFAGETKPRSIFRWYTTRRMGLEWDYDLNIFQGLVDFTDLVKKAKNPALLSLKQEWTFNPDDVELIGLNGRKSPKPSHWCSKLKHSEEHLGCEGRYPKWRFSFFDLIEIEGKTYITAATEKYQSPDDMNLPIVILVGRYVAPSEDTPLMFGSDRTMDQLEHRCYLIKAN